MYNRETNKSRGFGFVIYADAESVDRALETRMHIIDNKQAEVKRATPRVSSPIKPNVGIVKGNVKLNYNVCEKKNATVGQGDMISCRGRGRVEVKEILEQQNDRYRIELVRYK